jgi:hypothetical protein
VVQQPLKSSRLLAGAAAAVGTPPFKEAAAAVAVVFFLTALQELQERMRLLLGRQVLRVMYV